MHTTPGSLVFSAFLRKEGSSPNNMGTALTVEINETEVQVNIVKNNMHGNNISASLG
jgi:hypothetical protein